MAPSATQAIGQSAEARTLGFLRSQGLHCLQRNFRCKSGEIDLVMRDGRHLVFVEVRYRSGVAYGGAARTVDRRKQRKIIKTAAYFLKKYPACRRSTIRFDVVALDGLASNCELRWIRDAFRP